MRPHLKLDRISSIADCKFYEFLIRGGLAEDGATRLVSPEGVKKITHGTFEGLTRDSTIGKAFGLADAAVNSFNYGWAVGPKTDSAPHCNNWSGCGNFNFGVNLDHFSRILLALHPAACGLLQYTLPSAGA